MSADAQRVAPPQGGAPQPRGDRGARNRTVDVARGLGILLVVWGHNWWVLQHSETMFRVVYSFHVPLFFFLSGLFLKPQEPWGRTVVARAQGLLQPYGVTLLLGVVWAWVTGSFKPQPYLWGAMYASGPAIPNPWQALWFLPHLFVALMVTQALLRAGHRVLRPWMFGLLGLGVLAVGIMLLPCFGPQAAADPAAWGAPLGSGGAAWPGLPFSADVLGVSVAFVLAGWVLSPWVRSLTFQPLGWAVALLIFGGLHGVFIHDTMDLSMRRYTDPVVSTAMAAAGIALVLYLSAGLAQLPGLGTALSYIGSGSLFVLMFHVFFQVRMTGLVQAQWPQHLPWGAAMAWALSTALSLGVWEIVKRFRWTAWAFHQPLSRGGR